MAIYAEFDKCPKDLSYLARQAADRSTTVEEAENLFEGMAAKAGYLTPRGTLANVVGDSVTFILLEREE